LDSRAFLLDKVIKIVYERATWNGTSKDYFFKREEECVGQSNQSSNAGNNFAMNRRQFFRIGATVAAALALPVDVLAAKPTESRILSFYNYHTGERLSACYFSKGRYDSSALEEINELLRDHHNGKVSDIDRALLDLLWELGSRVGSSEPFHVSSGYRSPETNRMLRAKSKAVAKNIYHIKGKAVDIYLPDRSLSELRDEALRMRKGGVGYYPRPHFVHVDVGPVRRW
jgi:uncharacterized protein YcbK (DUF882 family)